MNFNGISNATRWIYVHYEIGLNALVMDSAKRSERVSAGDTLNLFKHC